MKIRIFGRDLFEFNAKGADLYAVPAYNQLKESKYLYDFRNVMQDGWSNGVLQTWSGSGSVVFSSDTNLTTATGTTALPLIKTPTPAQKKELTPKKVYSLEMLHDKAFKINMDPKHVDEQVAAFKEKLALIKTEEYDMRRGTEEIGSILLRMENRKKYASVAKTFEKFPYTTNARINSVVKKHDYLQLGQVAQFLADMPKEATDAMKEYNDACDKLCGKKAVFYIIANKKDFQKSEKRRDPILLAQSPFGHFWQILGAWDDEMLFLDEL
jgi:hypothetical protein